MNTTIVDYRIGNSLHFSQALKKGASIVVVGSMFVYSVKELGVLLNFPSQKEQEDILEYDFFESNINN